MTDVAAVVVNTNAGDDLHACVRSLFDRAGEVTLDVVVVDNDSRDGSTDVVSRAFPALRVIRNDRNRGFGAAANQGMRATDSEFVLLINPDARITGGTLEGLLKWVRDRPRAGVVGTLTVNPDGSVYPSARVVPSLGLGLAHTLVEPVWPANPWSARYRLAGWDRRSERRVDWVSGSSMLLRRAALDEVGLFDEDYFMYVEDMDLCTRMRAAGWEVWFCPELEIEHIVGTATRGQKRMTLEHSKSIYRYFVKHRARGWRSALRPLVWLAVRVRAALVSWRRRER